MDSLNKYCEIEDFRDPELVGVMRRVFADKVAEYGPSWPIGMEMRKEWEVSMAILAMQKAGVFREDAIALGVGAGTEATIFYLTNFLRWVFATDLYAAAGEWQHTASANMLTNPELFARIPMNRRRLVVQHMDARDLRYEDGTFDVVFSSSSIEHFGSWESVSIAAREMGRVLKPGGVLTLSTEGKLSGKGKGPSPDVLTFSWEEIEAFIIRPSGLDLLDRPKLSISPDTRSVVVGEAELVQNISLVLQGKEAQWATFPHIILDSQGYKWTSFHLALVKAR